MALLRTHWVDVLVKYTNNKGYAEGGGGGGGENSQQYKILLIENQDT